MRRGQLGFWLNDEVLVDISDSTLAEGDTALCVVSLDGECSDVAFDKLVVTASAPR